jgi:hypothetical protein
MIPATTDDCPMTEECPGYDRDRGVCLVRSGDCEFAQTATTDSDRVVDSGVYESPPGDSIGS